MTLEQALMIVTEKNIAISIVVRYKVLGFKDSGVRILLYLMRLGNAIIIEIIKN